MFDATGVAHIDDLESHSKSQSETARPNGVQACGHRVTRRGPNPQSLTPAGMVAPSTAQGSQSIFVWDKKGLAPPAAWPAARRSMAIGHVFFPRTCDLREEANEPWPFCQRQGFQQRFFGTLRRSAGRAQRLAS